MKRIINTVNAPATINYFQAVKVDSTLYLSGQIPLNPNTMEIESNDIEKQTVQILENIQSILSEEGYYLNDIIKIITYMTNINDFTKINKVYNKILSNVEYVRSLIEVSKLPKGSNIMIEIVAFK